MSPNIPFIILTEQHYCPVIFGSEPEAAATAEDDSLVYSNYNKGSHFTFPDPAITQLVTKILSFNNWASLSFQHFKVSGALKSIKPVSLMSDSFAAVSC